MEYFKNMGSYFTEKVRKCYGKPIKEKAETLHCIYSELEDHGCTVSEAYHVVNAIILKDAQAKNKELIKCLKRK